MSKFSPGKQWLPLFSSLELLVGPVTAIAADAARQAFAEAKGDFDFGTFDQKSPEAVAEASRIYERADKAYVLAMARHVVFDWRGVGSNDPNDNDELPFDRDLLPDLFEHHLVLDAFNEFYVRPYLEAVAEKNASSRWRNGSTPSAAKPIVGHA